MMKAYPQYTKTQIQCFPTKPSEWSISRYKNILKIMQGNAFKSSDYVDYSDVINVRMGNIKKGGRIDLTHNNKYLPNSHSNLYKEYILKEGDVIIAMTDISPSLDFLAVPAIIPNLDKTKTYLLNQRVGKLIIDDRYDVEFVKYLLLSNELRTQLKALGLGTVQGNMSSNHLYDSYFLCPPKKDREKIVLFLNSETSRIDNLIAEKENFIKLLSEKRQALISHVVTKGLNPNVPMKDSGVEWIGEIPEHWKIGALGYYGSVTSGSTPDRSNESFWNGDIPWIKTGEIKYNIITSTEEKVTEKALSGSSIRLSPKGTILMAMYGQGNTRGRVAILGIDSTYNQACAAITLNSQLFNSFLFNYYIAAYEHLRMEGNLTSQTNLNAEIIKKFKVVVPPIKEQREIVSFLESNLKKYDNLKEETLQSIELLKEHRTALISAAVTGKIDVREEV